MSLGLYLFHHNEQTTSERELSYHTHVLCHETHGLKGKFVFLVFHKY